MWGRFEQLGRASSGTATGPQTREGRSPYLSPNQEWAALPRAVPLIAVKLDLAAACGHGHLDQRSESIGLPVERLVHAEHALRAKEVEECLLGLVLPFRVEDAEHVPSGLLDQREARDVGEAVADVDHVLERDPPELFRNVGVDEQWILRRLAQRQSLVDLEQVSGLLGERDAPLDVAKISGLLLAELACIDLSEVVPCDLTSEDHLAESTRDDVELEGDVSVLRDLGLKSGEDVRYPREVAVVERRSEITEPLVRQAGEWAASPDVRQEQVEPRERRVVSLRDQRSDPLLPEGLRVVSEGSEELRGRIGGERIVEVEDDSEDLR